MKCRQITNDKKIVWFGSTGKNSETDKKIPAENYATEQNAIRSLLIQQLSIIKGELWFNMNLGIPLLDSDKSDIVFDSYISSILSNNPYIISIKKFVSNIINHTYTCSFIAETVYGDLYLSI